MKNNYLDDYLKENEGFALPLNEEDDIYNNINDNNKDKNDIFDTFEYKNKLKSINKKILNYNGVDVY